MAHGVKMLTCCVQSLTLTRERLLSNWHHVLYKIASSEHGSGFPLQLWSSLRRGGPECEKPVVQGTAEEAQHSEPRALSKMLVTLAWVRFEGFPTPRRSVL